VCPWASWRRSTTVFYRIVMPVLDFMQTMPAFVYLIPAIPFFGLGRWRRFSPR
jgi:ABC-type proline/glycine betaine transport system permease subunit